MREDGTRCILKTWIKLFYQAVYWCLALVELLFAPLLPSCLNEADRRLLGAGGGGVPVQVPVVDAQGCQIRVTDAVALVVWISSGVPSSAAFNLVLVR